MWSFLSRLRDQLGDASELLVGQARAFATQHGGDDLLGRSVEERVDEMAQRRFTRGVPRYRGHVHVAQSFFLVPHVPLVFEHTELRADGGVARIARELIHHLAGRGAAAAVEDVHDLALAARQRGAVAAVNAVNAVNGVGLRFGHAIFLAYC